MQAEYHREWLQAVTREDKPYMTNWGKVVSLVHEYFWDKTLEEECDRKMVLFVPKGRGDSQGIGLVEVPLKMVTGIINQSFTAAIRFHDTLHRFKSGRGVGNTSIEANLIQKIMEMREGVQYEIFLDPQKAYDALDRN